MRTEHRFMNHQSHFMLAIQISLNSSSTHRITHGHFRCRMIFLSSCIVLEPTLDGTILDATDLNHVIDASRIVNVRSANDGVSLFFSMLLDFSNIPLHRLLSSRDYI